MKAILINTYEFRSEVTKLSTRPLWLKPEPLHENNKVTKAKKSLVVLVHCESHQDKRYIQDLLRDINKMLKDTGRKNVILSPFGHLSRKLGKKEDLLCILNTCQSSLENLSYAVQQVHFGSHKTLDWHWCGHPAAVRFRDYGNKQYYTTEKYNEMLQRGNSFVSEYEKTEIQEIKHYLEVNTDKKVIDIGAGFGRVYCALKKQLFNKNYIGIEANQDFYNSFLNTLDYTKNHKLIYNYFQNIDEKLLGKDNLIICTQNTLGVIEHDSDIFYSKLKNLLKEPTNNLFLSVLRKDSLISQGVNFYEQASKMLGNITSSKEELSNGFLRTDTGYTSSWFDKNDLLKIGDLIGRKIKIKEYENFYFCYL